MGDNPIRKVKAIKSLGVYIDEHLSWSSHIDHLAKKISSGLAGLKQIRPFLPPETLVVNYKSLTLPYVDNCDVWAGLNKGISDRLDRLHSRAARIISDWEMKSADILKMLKWDTLRDRRQYHIAVIMFKILCTDAPEYLTEVFSRIYDGTAYKLRYLALQRANTDNFKIAVLNYGILLPHKVKAEQAP